MTRKPPTTKGPLIIIGGREELSPDHQRVILHEGNRCAAHPHKSLLLVTVPPTIPHDNAPHHPPPLRASLLVVTVAPNIPHEIGPDYLRAFRSLGVKHVHLLDIRTRAQAFDEATLKKLSTACAIFFTGGDQLRITS